MKKLVGLLMVLLCAGTSFAAIPILGGVPGGDFSRSEIGVAYSTGYWSSHISWANAAVSLVPDGGSPAPSNYAELWQEWFVRAANLWYVNYASTPTDQAWAVQADLMSNPGDNYCDRIFALKTQITPGTFTESAFSMDLDYVNNRIDWIAGSQSGSVAIANLPLAWTTAVIEYNPITGKATGKFGGTTVFDVTTTAALNVNTIFFSNYGFAYPSGGTFNIDNITAYAVPEPATLTLLGLAAGCVLRRRNR